MNILSSQIGREGKDLMSKRLTIEFIRSEFEKEGYTLLSNTYKYSVKLEYICLKEHKHSIFWNNWYKGYRCPYCAGQGKPTIEFIKEQFEKEGYRLLTVIYTNNHTKLEYICPEGHRHSVGWSSWQIGQRCPYCNGNAKLNIEFIRAEFKKEGYQLLTTVYEGGHQKLDYICPKGHEGTTRWGNWQQGKRCLKCSGNFKKTIQWVLNVMQNEGYTLLSTVYKNAHSKLYVKCPKGHCYYTTWHNWATGRRCPICPSKVSKWELEVKKYIKSLDVSFLSNSRDILINPFTGRNMELDLWFPELNKAIECNGVYWHSIKKASKRDKVKLMLCKQKDIDLLVLDDVKWAEDKSSCKHKIRNFITTKEAI